MRVMSNAFFSSAEIVQLDKWEHGPLEIAFVDRDMKSPSRLEDDYAISMWNMAHDGGHLRPGDIFDTVTAQVPGIARRTNPNIFLAPRLSSGYTELHAMLASLLPDRVLQGAHIERPRANLALSLVGRYQLPDDYASRVETAFAAFIWTKLLPGSRNQRGAFAKSASVRMLAGDVRFWMQRIFRIALERRELRMISVEDDPEWKPMDAIEQEFRRQLGSEDDSNYLVRRPLYGGDLWDPESASDRDDVIHQAIHGGTAQESLAPVLELLRTQRAHEDFSSQYSWVKEDFERSFYSKRAKLKVELISTADDAPVWETGDCDGYSDLLLRDLLAVINTRERKLLLAIREGRTPCEIAKEQGLRGHATISRRIAALKNKVAAILGD
jgi:hypothetical protein